MNFSRCYRCVFAIAVLASFPLRLHTQQPRTSTISYEGQQVSSVELAGRPDLNIRDLKQWIVQPQGAPYSQEKIDQSIAALKKAGSFTEVQVEVIPQPAGLQVLLIVQPALYFGIFEFGDATKVFSYNRLLQLADYPNQEPYTAGRVEQAESNLLTFFHRTGFFLATIEPELQTDQRHGLVNVLFHINLKRRAKFGNVVLTGASEGETQHLQKVLHSWMARLRGNSLQSGKTYSLEKLEKATSYLQSSLGKQHYLAARVQLISALYNPQTNRADVTFKVTQGPSIAVSTQGGHVWGRTMKKLVPIYQENAVDPDLVAEGSRNLASYFQSKGYFNAKVRSQIEQQPSGTAIVYQIEKGKRGKVGSIQVRGNQHFEENDLRPHITVAKSHFLTRGKYSEQLLRKSAKNLEAVYRNAGYSQAKVTPSVADQQGKLAITFHVDEGVQDVVDSLKIEGNKSLSEREFAPKGLNLARGKAYSGQLVDKDRDQIISVYLKRGYLIAGFKATAKPLKENAHRVEVVYSIDEGPQVRTAMVDTLGLKHTNLDFIYRHARIPVGQPLSETTLLTAESNLYSLGVFDWASIDPLRPITTESDNEVLIKVHEAKRNVLTYGVGFEVVNRGGNVPGGTVALPNLPPVGLPSSFKPSQQTFWGPRGSFEYSRLNFLGRAETLTIGGLAARLDQRAAISWANPSFWNSIWSSTVTVSGERSSENPIFTDRLVEGGFQVQRPLNASKTETLFLRYSLRRTDLTNLLIPQLVTPEDVRERLSTLSASYIRDTRDKALDAHRGIYESVETAINPSALGSNTNFVRFLGQAAYYQPIGGNNLVWANSLRLGLEGAFAGAHVPLSERFFAGGGSTIRGFSLNGAGPQRNVPVCSNPADTSTCSQITVPVGGNQLVIFNSEVRFPIPVTFPIIGDKLGGAVFYDGGNVYSSVGFQNFWTNYTNTVGFGVRYVTPVGPVRVDIGHLVNTIPGVKSTQLFITLGQAF
ncbi:MAG TPA: POTRA domain-containing protein [Candidatus Angelobacter sp.]|nr:POTRA domain-containing protein [Candidatus Angelobacter sp.]